MPCLGPKRSVWWPCAVNLSPLTPSVQVPVVFGNARRQGTSATFTAVSCRPGVRAETPGSSVYVARVHAHHRAAVVDELREASSRREQRFDVGCRGDGSSAGEGGINGRSTGTQSFEHLSEGGAVLIQTPEGVRDVRPSHPNSRAEILQTWHRQADGRGRHCAVGGGSGRLPRRGTADTARRTPLRETRQATQICGGVGRSLEKVCGTGEFCRRWPGLGASRRSREARRDGIGLSWASQSQRRTRVWMPQSERSVGVREQFFQELWGPRRG